LKIIHCLDHFLPEQIGGTEIYILSLAKSLLKWNIESIVLIPNYGKDDNEDYYVENVKVIKYGETSIANRAIILGKEIPKGIINFESVLLSERPDIVHFHSIGSSIGITIHHLVKAKALGFHTLITMHRASYTCQTENGISDGIINIKRYTAENYASKQLSPLTRKVLLGIAMAAYRINYNATNWQSSLGTAIGFPFVIKRLQENLSIIANKCDRIVVLSKWYRKVLVSNGVKESKLIHIAQGLPLQKTMQVELKVGKALKIVFIGRIIEEKGLHLLLQAIQHLPPSKISVDIYGQSNDSAYCKIWKDKTSGMANIAWKGIMEPERVVCSLGNYDLLCVPSSVSEMSPLVIQEGFAAGIPVMASNVYGNAEQIDDGINGWLFKFNDAKDLQQKLQMLTENPNIIQEAKKNIPEVRTFSDVAKDYKKLYEEVLHLQS
jgi:glycosyltransferase involved in cell wall biosynthesis